MTDFLADFSTDLLGGLRHPLPLAALAALA
jgi:hypothetical protein